MAALDVNRAVLIGEPMDQAKSEIVLGHERASSRRAEDQDIEPAHVIGEDQARRLDRRSLDTHPRPGNPCRRAKESSRPARSPEQQFAEQVRWRADEEQQRQRANA